MKYLFTRIGSIIENYFRSFDNAPIGYSRTKLVAYAFAAMTMIIQWSWMVSTIYIACSMIVAANTMVESGEYELALTMYKESMDAWGLLLAITGLNITTIMSLLGIKAYFKKKEKSKPETDEQTT